MLKGFCMYQTPTARANTPPAIPGTQSPENDRGAAFFFGFLFRGAALEARRAGLFFGADFLADVFFAVIWPVSAERSVTFKVSVSF